MTVLVDTAVWSLALRRSSPENFSAVNELKELISHSNATIIGPIRQEVLSGIRYQKQFDKLKEVLHAFPDHPITTADYELAADFFNTCRSRGIQGSNIDFLICAVSHNNQFPIFTTDIDFTSFQRYLPIELHLNALG